MLNDSRFTARLESSNVIDEIRQGYLAGQNRWVGCDWATDFGPRHLNLSGIRARQAGLLGCALAGAEAQAWFEAKYWLESVERDAADAALAASEALILVSHGDFLRAEESAGRACAIESKHPHRPVWADLLKAVQSARHLSPRRLGGESTNAVPSTDPIG